MNYATTPFVYQYWIGDINFWIGDINFLIKTKHLIHFGRPTNDRICEFFSLCRESLRCANVDFSCFSQYQFASGASTLLRYNSTHEVLLNEQAHQVMRKALQVIAPTVIHPSWNFLITIDPVIDLDTESSDDSPDRLSD